MKAIRILLFVIYLLHCLQIIQTKHEDVVTNEMTLPSKQLQNRFILPTILGVVDKITNTIRAGIQYGTEQKSKTVLFAIIIIAAALFNFQAVTVLVSISTSTINLIGSMIDNVLSIFTKNKPIQEKVIIEKEVENIEAENIENKRRIELRLKENVDINLILINQYINTNFHEYNPLSIAMEDTDAARVVKFSKHGFECSQKFCNKFGDGTYGFGVCTPFICQCSSGEPSKFLCEVGLVFDPYYKDCNIPHKVRICGTKILR